MAREARSGPGEHTRADELTTAVTTAELALGLIDLTHDSVLSISETWLAWLGLSAEAAIGRSPSELVQLDEEAAAMALTMLRDGVIEVYMARRRLTTASGSAPVTVWVRSFTLDGRRLALVQAAPGFDDAVSPLAKYLGKEPARMAIGTIDPDFTITAMSCDVFGLLGVEPLDLVGLVLLGVVARRDISPLLAASDDVTGNMVAVPVHLRNGAQEWVELCCLLTSLPGRPDRCFMLAPAADRQEDARVAELEHHLWSIAAIVEASGTLQRIGPMRDMTALPQANNLTTRQWEILARLVRGERVPTIAQDLHVSQSTVRNHLSAIFKRFGVRSQPELLRVIEAVPLAP